MGSVLCEFNSVNGNNTPSTDPVYSETISDSISTVINSINEYLNKDLNINTIISLNKKIKDKMNFIEKEYKEKPIIK